MEMASRTGGTPGRYPKAVWSEEEVLRWRREGKTYREIADLHEKKYGVRPSVSGLNSIRSRAGAPARNVHNPALVPWKISKEHRASLDLRGLRAEARLRAGQELSAFSFRIWSKWKKGLDESGLVVHYDPVEGFSHVPPRPGVDNDLVRVPDNFTTVRGSYDT